MLKKGGSVVELGRVWCEREQRGWEKKKGDQGQAKVVGVWRKAWKEAEASGDLPIADNRMSPDCNDRAEQPLHVEAGSGLGPGKIVAAEHWWIFLFAHQASRRKRSQPSSFRLYLVRKEINAWQAKQQFGGDLCAYETKPLLGEDILEMKAEECCKEEPMTELGLLGTG